MKYQVWISNLQYGIAHVEEDNPEKAKVKAEELYSSRSIDWHEEEISDMTVEEETE